MSRNFELLQQSGREPQVLRPGSARELPTVSVGVGAGESSPVHRISEWQGAWFTLRKHWRLSAYFVAGVIAAVVLMTLLTPSVYEPVARLEIDPPGAELFSLENRAADGGNQAEYVETQIQNLKGDALAIEIIRTNHLDEKPEFARRGILARVFGKEPTKSSGSETNLPGAQPLKLTPRESLALDHFRRSLTVKRDSSSRSVSISFASHDPVLAPAITNTIASTFIDRMYQARHDAIMQSTAWLSKQLDDIRARTEDSNRQLAEFQKQSGIADLERDRSTVSEEMSELSKQKTLASAERMQYESFLQKAKGNPESLPQALTSPVVQQLSQKLAEARAELSQASAIYGTEHPTVKKLQRGADELEQQLKLQRSLIMSQMQISYAAAVSRERLVDAEMRGATRKLGSVAEYNNLKKQAEANAELYNTLYAKVKEAGIAAASKSSNVRLVEEARVLDAPTSPKPLKNFGLGVFVAIVGGVLLAFIRESIDTRVRDINDVRLCTGITSVAVLPLAAKDPGTRLLGVTHRQSDGPLRFLSQNPQSVQAEALRSLHTSLMLYRPERPPQVVLVASSLPGEGKTTVAVNLATALANQRPTCLVDADLRRPALATAFRMRTEPGLRAYLNDEASFERITLATDAVPNLAVIPAGEAVSDAGALFTVEKMRTLIAELRAHFDFVVVDSPPILAYSDGRVLAPFVDGIVFVGRASVVTKDAMTRSMELLAEVHSAPIIEIVLNGADPKVQPYNYSYASSYYRNN